MRLSAHFLKARHGLRKDMSVAVRLDSHGIFGFLKHLLVSVPGEMDEFGIGADRNDVGPGFLNSSCCSARAANSVAWTKVTSTGYKKDDPFFRNFLCGRADSAETTLCWFKSVELEIRNTLTNLHGAAIT